MKTIFDSVYLQFQKYPSIHLIFMVMVLSALVSHKKTLKTFKFTQQFQHLLYTIHCKGETSTSVYLFAYFSSFWSSVCLPIFK